MNRLIELFGWCSMVAILAAYAAVQFEILLPKDLLYLLLNLTGSIGIVAVSVLKQNPQPAVLNLIWALIAIVGVIKFLVAV